MKFLSWPGKLSVFFLLAMVIACSTTDITNDQAVMDDLQGTWTGTENSGEMVQHIRLKIEKDSFKGWVQTTDSSSQPEWAETPDEEGLISLSSVLTDPDKQFRYRKFAFTCNGRCCGDKSLSLKALSTMLTYVEGKGLTVGSNNKAIKMN